MGQLAAIKAPQLLYGTACEWVMTLLLHRYHWIDVYTAARTVAVINKGTLHKLADQAEHCTLLLDDNAPKTGIGVQHAQIKS